ncbi:TipJ family phage tail tip protein [Pseudomonas yamanorum]|uniref:TipJ family phage tail tip protein n=1 Tax=Pseudomonas yamanorum TaxID=515393 RepID=UPI00087B39C7|nr:phage tail protein [Pseudomonas yamanorum]SDT97548.1 Phage-related protein, tail component [Pseudomonas yamanorum]
MGAAKKLEIHGAKGGESKPKSPVESPDSLRSTNVAKILIAVGEGEFDGTPTARDIFLDNTPIQDASGNFNFTNVKWDWRPGSVEQTYIPGIPSVDNETSLNIELRNGTPWVQSLTNLQLSAARIRLATPRLASQDAEGNIGGYSIQYAVDVATDGGAYQEVLVGAITGKTTTRYERSLRVDLPPATSGWLIRVRRITPNQNTDKIADSLFIAGYTQVIDAKLRYPNTALLFIEFDAEQFTNIPAVTVKCKARRWQVPSNYDPVARTYSGAWDGTMKEAWTNNPAWITFGICTQDRFGLGRRIKPWMVDKWELYRIAQYCDQMVPNGSDGVEPRFLCDMNLQGKADAWSLLRDIAGIYRGMTYWAQGQLVMQADMPRSQDIDYVFTRSNVIDGKISYGSASAKTRFTRCLVSYDNPLNNYDTDVTVYSDLPLQRRLGDKPTEISAIGCTRASEAQRRAKWLVLSNNQDRTISFRTGMEGRIPLPGFIIPVADSLLAGREIGGRIAAAAGKVITLDRDTLAKVGDRLVINLPGGRAEGRTVESVSGRNVTVTVAYSEAPAAQLQWAIDADDLAIPLYRVMRTARTPEGDYDISALQYEPSKFASIDTGARLEERPISVIPITVVPPPESVTVTSNVSIDQGLAISTMNISWPAVNGAVAYDVEWRKDSGNWIKVQRTGSTSVDVTGIYSGAYVARVRSVSAFEISSIWKSSNLTNLEGKVGLPPAVSSLTTTSELFGIGIKWAFPPGAEDTQRTELWYGPANDLGAATKLADLAYPQADYRMQSLLAGASFFFWARLVDRTGNIGPFYPVVNGVVGQASSDAGPILEQIKGQINETSLGQLLNERINLIDGDGPGSANNRISIAKQELEDLIDEVVDSLEYDPAKAYAQGEIVRVGQRLYQANAAVPANTAPPNATYWTDIGTVVQTVNALVTQVQQNSATINQHGQDITAQASQLNAVKATVNDPVTGVTATASGLSTLKASVTTLDDKVTTTAQRVDGIYLQVNPPLQGDDSALMGSEASYVGVWSTQSALIEGDLVQGQRTDVVEVSVANTAAAVIAEQTARITADGALSSSIETVKNSVNGNTLAIQTNTTAIQTVDGKVTANWSVRMQYETATGLYKYAGVGLGLENGPGGLQSQFIIDADRFAIGQAGTVPFAVQGGQTFINSAFIQDGTITNAKIGNYIQSNNYVAGLSGWKLFFDGTFEINGSFGGQARQVINNRGGKVFDAAGNKRYQWGDLDA